MAITTEQAQRYRDEGFLAPIPILGAEEAASRRRQFDALEAQVGREQARIQILDAHYTEQFVWELATHPKVLDAVSAAIGPNILLLGTHFICKYGEGPSAEAFLAWHQDLTYWGLEPAVAITAWIAIDDSDVDNGCMRVIPGSHRAGIHVHGKSDKPGNMLRINQAIETEPLAEQRAVDVVLRAGEMSLHDGLVVHGSPPNRSSRRRCGLASKYVPTYVRQREDQAHTRSRAILVRGADREQHFTAIERPFA